MLNRKNIHTMTHSDPKLSELFDIDLKKSIRTINFPKFCPQDTFLGKFGPETSKCFV